MLQSGQPLLKNPNLMGGHELVECQTMSWHSCHNLMTWQKVIFQPQALWNTKIRWRTTDLTFCKQFQQHVLIFSTWIGFRTSRLYVKMAIFKRCFYFLPTSICLPYFLFNTRCSSIFHVLILVIPEMVNRVFRLGNINLVRFIFYLHNPLKIQVIL